MQQEQIQWSSGPGGIPSRRLLANLVETGVTEDDNSGKMKSEGLTARSCLL